MKNKYVVFILLAVIIICSFGIYFFIKNSDLALDKSNPMTKDEVIELLNKGRDYKNHYCKLQIEDSDHTYECYIKDGIKVTFVKGKILNWSDYNTGDSINFFQFTDKKPVAAVTTLDESVIESDKTSQCGFSYSTLINGDMSFKYLGETKINDRTTIVIKLTSDDYIEKWYIDKETGIIIKEITKMFGKTIIENKIFKLDVVTDEDVMRPDLSEYDVVY